MILGDDRAIRRTYIAGQCPVTHRDYLEGRLALNACVIWPELAEFPDLFRWFHVNRGVALDRRLFLFHSGWDNHLARTTEWKKHKGIKRAICGRSMVAVFNEVAKFTGWAPKKCRAMLHWFKWEAYSTLHERPGALLRCTYFGNPRLPDRQQQSWR